MNSIELQRVVADVYNDTTEPKDAISKYSADVILRSAEQFRLVIENGEVPLTMAPLSLATNLHVIIDLLDKDVDIPALEYGYNKFSLTGRLGSIDDFLFWINDILAKKISPLPSLGRFTLHDGNLLTFTAGATAGWDLIEMWLSPELADALRGFWVRENRITEQGETWYRFSQPAVNEVVTQSIRSINSIIHMKSIRILSDLPVQSTMVTGRQTRTLLYQRLIATMMINSEEYDLLSRRNQLLIPTSELKRFQLNGSGEVKEFTIEAKVYYKNGEETLLKMAPREYMTFALLFEKIHS